MQLPFKDRYSHESDTRHSMTLAYNVCIKRADEELIIDKNDPCMGLFFSDVREFNFHAGVAVSQKFFDELCGLGNGFNVEWQTVTGVKNASLSEILWIYNHRPDHWAMPYRQSAAVRDLQSIGRDLKTELQLLVPDLPQEYDQKLKVTFTRGSRQGMLANKLHVYKNITVTFELEATIDNVKHNVTTTLVYAG